MRNREISLHKCYIKVTGDILPNISSTEINIEINIGINIAINAVIQDENWLTIYHT